MDITTSTWTELLQQFFALFTAAVSSRKPTKPKARNVPLD